MMMTNAAMIQEAAQGEIRRRWRVVVSKPNAERLAKRELENQGFEVYLPIAVSEKPTSPRLPKGGLDIRPFFPRYLFVNIDPTYDRWRCIFSTFGVSSMLLDGDKPLAVRDEQIERIRCREEGGMIKVMSLQDQKVFQPGQRVKVDFNGMDLDALFLMAVDSSRVKVMLSIFGREAATLVHPASIR